ncbi:MAG: hypothetical protein C0505_11090 [Leptothrix sp. (in: Bacteria)]|nr:hypothetical protein [Leptothrix sp. (in: b-proteobacteria)]
MRPRRAGPLLALGVGVLAAHLWLADGVLPPPLGADDAPRVRFEVAFVRELAPAAAVPPPPVVRPRPRVATLAASPVSPAASAASAAEALAPVAALPEPEPVEAESVLPLPDLPPLPEPAAGPAAATASDLAASASAEGFEWPPSTRLSYILTGNVRGPVEGQAKVEWLRQGTRYQVFLEASVGPSFAPLLTRRESSEGEITAQGLRPRRYDMAMDVIFRDTRRSTIFMDADSVRLPNGTELPRPPGLQDAVSQFVQLSWLFTTQPQRLRPGETIELSLALPRRVEPWFYDVVASETLYTSAGPVDTMHVRPRRAARAGDYTAEVWIAPALQYLPVRIVVRQDAETFIDLQIERLPEQAERGR